MNDGERVKRGVLTCFYLIRPVTNGASSKIQVGFLVDSTSTNAVNRNRIKRLMRESFRRLKNLVQENMQEKSVSLIFSVRRFERNITLNQMYAEMESLLEEIGTKFRSPQ